MKTIVISAVNIRKGGTLTILRQCLEYLSILAQQGEYKIVAIVHKKELADYSNIEYIEMPNIIKGWSRRLWCEYVTMYKISKKLQPIHLWLSLHDTTPRVIAERRAVYCQTSFPFLKQKFSDWKYDYKIGLFSLFTKYAYKINIKKNNYLIVQADWLRQGFSKMFKINPNKFIVAPPEKKAIDILTPDNNKNNLYTFLYPATPDCHKNFEFLCEAAKILEAEIGSERFRIVLTISGVENNYSKMIKNICNKKKTIIFAGYLDKSALYEYYTKADCLVFPSRIETWGLPITEFAVTEKPMLLADLPYSHETSSGAKKVSFFNINNPIELKNKMKSLILGDLTFLKENPEKFLKGPIAYTWKDLFNLISS
jgi:Glycosyltransferase